MIQEKIRSLRSLHVFVSFCTAATLFASTACAADETFIPGSAANAKIVASETVSHTTRSVEWSGEILVGREAGAARVRVRMVGFRGFDAPRNATTSLGLESLRFGAFSYPGAARANETIFPVEGGEMKLAPSSGAFEFCSYAKIETPVLGAALHIRGTAKSRTAAVQAHEKIVEQAFASLKNGFFDEER